MPDNGPRRSLRIGMVRFRIMVFFFCLMPVICALLTWVAWHFWGETRILQASVQRFEDDCRVAQATAERLEHLEELLSEESVPARELILRRLAGGDGHARLATDADGAETRTQESEMPEGPGHEDFPSIENGAIKVSNVQARWRGNKLRITLDLANTQNQKLLAGTVDANLVLADGRKMELDFIPADVGNFRINRFKRTVMLATLPRSLSLVNAQVIIDVRDQDNTVLYRNIFPVLR